MLKRANWSMGFILLVLVAACIPQVSAQSTRGVSLAVTCPVAGGSIQVRAALASRYSIVMANTSDTAIRWGYVASGTPNLTDANSYVLNAATVYADSFPGVFIGRFVCMSTTAVAKIIYVSETSRP